jgi:hypothetical protein
MPAIVPIFPIYVEIFDRENEIVCFASPLDAETDLEFFDSNRDGIVYDYNHRKVHLVIENLQIQVFQLAKTE